MGGTPIELKAELDALAQDVAGVDPAGYWPPDSPRLSNALTLLSAELELRALKRSWVTWVRGGA